MYFSFVVQGNKKNPSAMNFEIDNILARLRDKIIALPENKFKEIITSIKNELAKRDTNLKERTKKIWQEILYNSLDFNRKDKLLIEVQKINKKDILDTFDSIFIDKPEKLSIQIYSGKSENLNSEGEEIYYLNANLKYTVTSDIKILNNIGEVKMDDEDR
jgi:secreted Zn-dependent insulinase-like peptidase